MISIIAPAFNEEAVIQKYVREVIAYCRIHLDSFEVIVINDGSEDGTLQILSELQLAYAELVVVSHPQNKGIGKALEIGFKSAKGDIVVTMDADCSHDPELIKQLCAEIGKGYDIVIASRYVGDGCMKGIPVWRQVLSKYGNKAMQILLGWPAKDSTSGYRAYRTEVVKTLDNLSPGFEVQVEILMELKNTRVKEIPFALHNRAAGQSKMEYSKLAKTYLKMIFA